MGCKTKDLFNSDGDGDRNHDALIFTSMCIVGLPVEVQVKDGSIYSGIVHTACFDNQYGIILKKAKLINGNGKGTEKCLVVDTLVVSSSDLVQVVVKGLVLPSHGNITHAPSDNSASTRNRKHHLSHSRQAWKDQSKGKNSEPYQKFGSHKDTSIQEVQLNEIGSNDSLSQLQSTFSTDAIICKTTSNGPSCGNPLPSLVKADAQDFERPTSTGSCSDVCSSSVESVDTSSLLCNSQSTSQTPLIAPSDSVSNASSKEFKLNPGAKTFIPLFSIPKSASPPAPTTTASTHAIPDTLSMLPAAVAPQENALSHFLSHSSLPTKNNNVVAITGDNGFQHSQPILANVGSRLQSVRYTNQYNPVQAVPTFVHPSPQTVIVSRFGQLVYMHPISHDLIQSSAVPTTVTVMPQLTPPVFPPKHQGSTAAQASQISVTQQPFVVGGQSPYVMTSHIPYLQTTFPGHLGTKFL